MISTFTNARILSDSRVIRRKNSETSAQSHKTQTNRVRPGDGADAFQALDLVGLEQGGDTLRETLDGALLGLEHLLEVHRRRYLHT